MRSLTQKVTIIPFHIFFLLMLIFVMKVINYLPKKFEYYINFHLLDVIIIEFLLSFVYNLFIISLHKDINLEMDVIDNILIIFLIFLLIIAFILLLVDFSIIQLFISSELIAY
jgi:hypothetical protein